MRKFFTFVVGLMFALAGNAANSPLDLTDLGSGWGSSYDPATKTITYDGAWNGKGWWLEDKDCTGFTKVVVETAEPLAGYAKIVVEYANGTASTEGGVEAGNSKIEALIAEEGAAHVKQIYIQAGFAGKIVLKDAYLSGETVDLSKIWEGNASFGVAWDWNSTIGLAGSAFVNVKSGDSLILTFATDKEAEYSQLKVLFGQWGNQTHGMPSALKENADPAYDTFNVEADQTYYTIKLTDEDIATLKSQGVRISGYNVTLTNINSKVVVPTGISNTIAAPVANPNAPIFNLAGQKVSKAYKGVVIQNGKKFVQK